MFPRPWDDESLVAECVLYDKGGGDSLIPKYPFGGEDKGERHAVISMRYDPKSIHGILSLSRYGQRALRPWSLSSFSTPRAPARAARAPCRVSGTNKWRRRADSTHAVIYSILRERQSARKGYFACDGVGLLAVSRYDSLDGLWSATETDSNSNSEVGWELSYQQITKLQ